jgi:hypothetical protein
MAIGFRQGRFGDTARPNWTSDGPRPLGWVDWYPAADDAIEREPAFDPPRTWFAIGPAARDARNVDLQSDGALRHV